jgi:hypothetical protein
MLLASSARAQDCTPGWVPTFPGSTGVSDYVADLVVFDDGTGGGPGLYATGYLVIAGGSGVNFVARWDGESWSALGTGGSMGVNSPARALAVYDDGGGPALYVGGSFTLAGGEIAHRIAKWDGRSWSNLGSGMDGDVWVLSVFDDGSGGPELYAGGEFTTAGGITVNHIAKWNGTSWRALGSGTNPTSVMALASFDDGRGGGPALYVGGTFTEAGGEAASHIARWDGGSWSSLGHGVSGPVLALTVVDVPGGAGPRLCAGGLFQSAGSLDIDHIALWDGTTWSPLGSGMSSSVLCLAAFDDGSGPALFAGGGFLSAGGTPAKRIAKWDGTSWSPLGSGMSNGGVLALESFDDGSGAGPALFVGGNFEEALDSGDAFLAKWGCSPSAWTDLGFGLAGISGVPALAGTGTLEPGSPGALALTNAQPTALTNLFVSFASTPAPFKGGVLVPVPSALMLSLFTNGAGSIPLAWTAWPAGIPSASTLYFQYAIQDAAAPAGVALSNALRAVTP